MAAAVAAAIQQQPPQAAPGPLPEQEQDDGQQPLMVEGTMSSPRLPRQLSIRSKLLYSAIQEVRA